VTPGQTINVERLPVDKGSKVQLDRVLMLADTQDIMLGDPFVEGARVLATVTGEKREKKIIVFKYKSKVRYRRKLGHRQIHTALKIEKIVRPGENVDKNESVIPESGQTSETTEKETSSGS